MTTLPSILLGALQAAMPSPEAELSTGGAAILQVALFFLMIGYPMLIIGTVFWCMLLYQLWKQIPGDIARTTPGKAVGFCFIPLYNLYWGFVAFAGLGEDMSKALQRYGIQYKVNVGLGTTTSILWLVSWLLVCLMGHPATAIMSGLASLALTAAVIFFFKSVKDGAIALSEQNTSVPKGYQDNTTVPKVNQEMASASITLGCVALGILLFPIWCLIMEVLSGDGGFSPVSLPLHIGGLCLIICFVGILIGHRGLKTGKAKPMLPVLYFSGFAYLISLLFLLYGHISDVYLIHSFLSEYYGEYNYSPSEHHRELDYSPFYYGILVSVLYSLWHIPFILGVFFGHKGLQTSKAKAAKLGLYFHRSSFLIYVLVIVWSLLRPILLPFY
ncbi:MAG: hypothetical protein FWH04_10370 [Oscillospiraceae bacterium]|nr:hypothetical protein [Oscillospiraceae bacterium]